MTEMEEEFVHLSNSIDNLNNALQILDELTDAKLSPTLFNASFQYALIEYSKPYKDSYGWVLNEKGKNIKYKLDDGFIPPEHFDLHKRIIDARDKFHAHSDLTLLRANVYVKGADYGKVVVYTKNKIYGTEEFENIESIKELIKGTLDTLYQRKGQLKADLPENQE